MGLLAETFKLKLQVPSRAPFRCEGRSLSCLTSTSAMMLHQLEPQSRRLKGCLGSCKLFGCLSHTLLPVQQSKLSIGEVPKTKEGISCKGRFFCFGQFVEASVLGCRSGLQPCFVLSLFQYKMDVKILDRGRRGRSELASGRSCEGMEGPGLGLHGAETPWPPTRYPTHPGDKHECASLR